MTEQMNRGQRDRDDLISLRLRDVSRGSLDHTTARLLEEALERHYGEPVRALSDYCKAFSTWWAALATRAEGLSEGDYDGSPDLTAIGRLSFRIELAIRKSNLLDRLIYSRQPLRTEKCPKHDGHWSGCYFEPERWCACMDGMNVTGWLPNHRLTMAELINRWLVSQGKPGGSYSTRMDGMPRPHRASALGHSCDGATFDEACQALANLLVADGFVPEEWQPVAA